MPNDENLNRYRIFLAAAECGSISRAAQQLYISQPAVSTGIKKLEESMGTTLFIRKSKGVVLTENGRILYDGLSRAMHLITASEERIRHTAGALRIAASHVLCKHMLMPYLQRFTEAYPNADVSITCTSSAQARILLEECKVDLALVAKPDNIQGFEYYPLGMIEDVFVCAPSYAERLGCAQGELLEKGNIMLLNKSNVSRMYIDSYYAKNQLKSPHILEATDMDLLIEFAKIGLGISCVVKQFIEPELHDGTLLALTLPAPIPPREMGFLYHPDSYGANTPISKFIHIKK